MYRSKMPVKLWFQAAYLLTTSHSTGLSALGFKNELGLTNYVTAFTLLQRLRIAMKNSRPEKLSGDVEVHVAFVGGLGPGKKGRGSGSMVIGAVDLRKGRVHKLRLKAIEPKSTDFVMNFVRENVEQGSVIIADNVLGLQTMPFEWNYRISGGSANVEKVFFDIQNWLIRTYHGVSQKHIQEYLDEYAFRFNMRRTPLKAFQTVLGIGRSALCSSDLELENLSALKRCYLP